MNRGKLTSFTNYLLLIIFGIWSNVLTAQTCTSSFVRYPKMGANAGPYFNDLFIQLADPNWGSASNPFNRHPSLDANDYPTSDCHLRMGMEASITAGIYKLEFECNNPTDVVVGTQPGGCLPYTVQNKTNVGNIVRADINVASIPAWNPNTFAIPFRNTNGGIRNVRLLRPGIDYDNPKMVDARYMKLIDQFSTLRFHDMNSASGNPVVKWSDRQLPGRVQQKPLNLNSLGLTHVPSDWANSRGYAYEYQIEMCNEGNKDMWVCVPVRADDDYVRNLALLLKERLNDNLVINIELGNEIWNNAGGFWGSTFMREGVIKDKNSGTADQKTIFGGANGVEVDNGSTESINNFGAWSAHQRRIGRRLKDIVQIFGQVFGENEINKKIRGILCGQIGYHNKGHGWNIAPTLAYLNAYYGDPSKYLYAVGVAPYYGGELNNSMTKDQVLQTANANIDCRFQKTPSNACLGGNDNGNQLEGIISQARRYGLKIYAYEAAPDYDIITGGNPRGYEAPTSPSVGALKDPRSRDLAVKYYSKWFSWCGEDAITNYYAAKVHKDFGWPYALAEDLDNSTNSPTYAGIKQVLSSPAPPLDGGHVIRTNPTITDIPGNAVAGMNITESQRAGLMYVRSSQGEYHYLISVNQNGRYTINFEYDGSGSIQILIDGVKKLDVNLINQGSRKFLPTPIELDLFYGIHNLSIKTVTPSNSAYSLYKIRTEYKNIKYPPAAPNGIVATQGNICANSSDVLYRVKTIDGSVCYYKWILPTTASFTGDNTPEIKVDWKNTPLGAQTIKLVAGNEDGWSDTTKLAINIINCGIGVSNASPCISSPITITDETQGSSNWDWNFGAGATPQVGNQKNATVTYTTAGSKTISLKINQSGVEKTFTRLINVISCNIPTVTSPLRLCKGGPENAVTATASNGGTNLKWYTAETEGTVLASAPIASTSATGARTYWVSQMNGSSESDRAKLEVIVSDTPTEPAIATLAPYCVGATARVEDLTGKVTLTSGAVSKWYASNDATASTAAPTMPNTSTANSTSWFVSQAIGVCESPKVEMNVSVVPGPVFTAVASSPANCGEKGKITISRLIANESYQISYNNVAPASMIASANNDIELELPAGNYTTLKVDNLSCSTTDPNTFTITDPTAPAFTVTPRNPKTCGALGALVLKGLGNNTAYKIGYNGGTEQTYSSKGDSIVLPLAKGNYSQIKLLLGTCSKEDPATYRLEEPVIIPPVVPAREMEYCQNQVVTVGDVTSRVQGEPAYKLRWYTAIDGIPSNEPLVNTTNNEIQSIWVSQVDEAGCSSDKVEFKVRINESTALTATGTDPTSCNVADGKLLISGLRNVTNYRVEYNKEGARQPMKEVYSSDEGSITIEELGVGTYGSITVTPESGTICLTKGAEAVTLKEPGSPATPTITGKKIYCSEEAIGDLTASGTGIEWYGDEALTNRLPSQGNSFTPTLTNGTATYYAVAVDAGCKSIPTTATVAIIAPPVVKTITGTGGSASCNGSGYELILQTQVGVVYSMYNGSSLVKGDILGEGKEQVLGIVSEEGKYTVKAEASGSSCMADMGGSLEVTPRLTPTNFAMYGDTVCEGSGTTAFVTLLNSELEVEYALFHNGSLAETMRGTGQALIFPREASVSSIGEYSITATYPQSGCSEEMYPKANILVHGVISDPTIEGSQFYCNTGTSQINATSISEDTRTIWSMRPAEAGAINETGLVTWDNNYIGDVFVSLTVISKACETVEKTATLATKTTSLSIIKAIEGDSIACRGNIKKYQVSPVATDMNYSWSVSSNLNIQQQDDVTGTIILEYNMDIPIEGTQIMASPTSTQCGTGEVVSKLIKKGEGCDLFVPNVLTPGSADNNSVWAIEGINNFPKLNIQIFNRWGGRVYSNTGIYSKPWDGTHNGQPLPTATYYYVIDKADGSEKVTGSITVVRD